MGFRFLNPGPDLLTQYFWGWGLELGNLISSQVIHTKVRYRPADTRLHPAGNSQVFLGRSHPPQIKRKLPDTMGGLHAGSLTLRLHAQSHTKGLTREHHSPRRRCFWDSFSRGPQTAQSALRDERWKTLSQIVRDELPHQGFPKSLLL